MKQSVLSNKLDRAEDVKLAILDAVVNGYHKCSVTFRVRDTFIVKRKIGERGLALTGYDDDRGKLTILYILNTVGRVKMQL